MKQRCTGRVALEPAGVRFQELRRALLVGVLARAGHAARCESREPRRLHAGVRKKRGVMAKL
jgi:hypothetical protein